jgi:hypothetical protein
LACMTNAQNQVRVNEPCRKKASLQGPTSVCRSPHTVHSKNCQSPQTVVSSPTSHTFSCDWSSPTLKSVCSSTAFYPTAFSPPPLARTYPPPVGDTRRCLTNLSTTRNRSKSPYSRSGSVYLPPAPKIENPLQNVSPPPCRPRTGSPPQVYNRIAVSPPPVYVPSHRAKKSVISQDDACKCPPPVYQRQHKPYMFAKADRTQSLSTGLERLLHKQDRGKGTSSKRLSDKFMIPQVMCPFDPAGKSAFSKKASVETDSDSPPPPGHSSVDAPSRKRRIMFSPTPRKRYPVENLVTSDSYTSTNSAGSVHSSAYSSRSTGTSSQTEDKMKTNRVRFAPAEQQESKGWLPRFFTRKKSPKRQTPIEGDSVDG